MTRPVLTCFLVAGLMLLPVIGQALGIGDKAPLFTALSDKGEVSLQDYLGDKYVIISFYFAINTPAWKSTVLAFKRDLETFESLSTQVLGVSSDNIGTLKAFAEKNSITFPLISDVGGKLKSLYSKKRINYLIDKNGVIQMIQKGIPKNEYFIDKIRTLEN